MMFAIWEFLCLTLLWFVFSRSVAIQSTGCLRTRVALLLAGVAALFGLAAPFYGWHPDVVTLFIVGTLAGCQSPIAEVIKNITSSESQ